MARSFDGHLWRADWGPIGPWQLAEIAAEPGSLRIVNAFQLADQLARSVRRMPSETGVLHLFASGPNGFQFYLGRLARRWGAIQLYEHDFEKKPSLALPQPAVAREGRPAASSA